MAKKIRHTLSSNSEDYHKGYADGMKGAFEESELDAYYAGVGYGKKAAGVKHIGFSSPEEREQFEKGVEKSSKHFQSFRSEPPTLLERLLGISDTHRRIRRSRKTAKRTFKRDSRVAKRRKKYKTKVVKRRNREMQRFVDKKMLPLVAQNTPKIPLKYRLK